MRRTAIRSFSIAGIPIIKSLLFVPLIALLLAPVTEKKTITRQTLCHSTTSWDGTALPAYGKGQPQITIKRITIPPGVRLPMHKHPVINAGVLLRGTLTVESDEGKKLILAAGDPIVELVDRWHRGINEGEAPAEILVFYAGTVGTPLTVKK